MSDNAPKVITLADIAARKVALAKERADLLALEKAARKTVNLPPVLEMGITVGEYKDREVPVAYAHWPLLVQPSVSNGYGKLLIGGSNMGRASYVAAGVLPTGFGHDGAAVEIEFSARIVDPDYIK